MLRPPGLLRVDILNGLQILIKSLRRRNSNRRRVLSDSIISAVSDLNVVSELLNEGISVVPRALLGYKIDLYIETGLNVDLSFIECLVEKRRGILACINKLPILLVSPQVYVHFLSVIVLLNGKVVLKISVCVVNILCLLGGHVSIGRHCFLFLIVARNKSSKAHNGNQQQGN